MTGKLLRTLIVDDSELDAGLLLMHLRSLGYELEHRRVDREDTLRSALADAPWDVILCDYSMPEFDGLRAFAVVRELALDVPFIVVSGAVGEETAVECMKKGIHDFVLKNRLARLGPAIERELAEAAVRCEQQLIKAQLTAAQDALMRAEKLRALGQMAAGVAHDLKNILNPLSLQLDLTRKAVQRGDAQRANEVIDDMKGVLRRGVETIARLKDYGREASAQRRHMVDLVRTAREGWTIARARIASRPGRAPSFVDALDEAAHVAGDASDILNAVVNLLVNAIDAMPEGGTITLRTRELPHAAALIIEDDGPGIPPEVKERVFEPFYTTKGDQGTGLGLAMVYACMQRHGGEVILDTQVGRGTRFELVFPVGEVARTA